MKNWIKLPWDEISRRVFAATEQNVNFYTENVLGVPASHLDDRVFPIDAPFLGDTPFISTMIHNPNHIGCHTLGDSEAFFAGTQKLEQEVIRICAEDILKGEADGFDGYIASGGTEANIQAAWIYRNYFMQECGAKAEEICLLCSADSHYSMVKAVNLLGIRIHRAVIDPEERLVDAEQLQQDLNQLRSEGVRYFIVVANMMTTMFGSVDDPDIYTDTLEALDLEYRLHIDGAYGGFFYPFSNQDNTKMNFANPKVSSIALDAHKMMQAPYGTGIFLSRKGLIRYVFTQEASYVKGLDATLIGSRSGANAVAVWMILMSYGPHGWYEKIQVLQLRTEWLCRRLDELNIRYYRQAWANIVTIQALDIENESAHRFGLVPDNHDNPNWFKIVVMDHVTVDKLEPFIQTLKTDQLKATRASHQLH